MARRGRSSRGSDRSSSSGSSSSSSHSSRGSSTALRNSVKSSSAENSQSSSTDSGSSYESDDRPRSRRSSSRDLEKGSSNHSYSSDSSGSSSGSSRSSRRSSEDSDSSSGSGSDSSQASLIGGKGKGSRRRRGSDERRKKKKKRKHGHSAGKGGDDKDTRMPTPTFLAIGTGIVIVIALIIFVVYKSYQAGEGGDEGGPATPTTTNADSSTSDSGAEGSSTTSRSSTTATGTKTSQSGSTSSATKTSSDDSSATTTQASGTGSSSSLKVGGYWPNYQSEMSAGDIPYSDYDMLYYFVAVPGAASENGALDFGGDDSMATFVKKAKAAECTPILTIGGWTGSATLSDLVADESTRDAFAKLLVEAVEENGFEALDIDWEYPGSDSGASGNAWSKEDLANFEKLLKTLKDTLADGVLLMAATSAPVWRDESGSPSTDVSAFGELFDHILIMTYDLIQSSSEITGPQSALSADCAPESLKSSAGDIATWAKAWTDAKFPKEKILIGIPAYAYAFKVSEFVEGGTAGASSDIYQKSDGAGADALINFVDLADKISGDTYTRRYDNCSSSPWLYSKSEGIMIPYDDAESAAAKASWVKENGYGGAVIFDVQGEGDASFAKAIRKTFNG